MKKILLSLFVGFVGIISFCSAGTFTIDGNVNDGFDNIMNIPQRTFGTNFTVQCIFDSSFLNCQGGDALSFVFKYGKVYSSNMNSTTTIDTDSSYSMNCDNPANIVVDFDFSTVLPGGGPYGGFYGVTYIKFDRRFSVGDQNIPYSCTFVGNNILNSGGGSCPECPEVNTGEILSGYILESSIDDNYCVSNNLCPVNTGDSASWSELVINDIVHQSAPLISINIPEEFDWSYTVDENEFDLGISGYNVDTEYIDGIITAQTVKPNSSDFNRIITELIPLFVPGLVIILFIWFVFRFVKKVF